MVAKVQGIFIKQGTKNRVRDGQKVEEPYIVIYSGNETVRIPNVRLNPELKIGTQVEIACDISLREWDNRKYLSIRPLEG